MAKARKDLRGRALRKGEMQRNSDKRYGYSYTDPLGRRNLKITQSIMGHKDIKTTMPIRAVGAMRMPAASRGQSRFGLS